MEIKTKNALSFLITTQTRNALDYASAREGESFSRIINRAITQYVEDEYGLEETDLHDLNNRAFQALAREESRR